MNARIVISDSQAQTIFNAILKHATKEKRESFSNKIMFMTTPGFRFLDIINYLGPGTSYEKWVKAYECEGEKGFFPYDWFDTPEKLEYPGLPPYSEWYSSLKKDWVLTLDEYARCQRLFQEIRGLAVVLQQSGCGARSGGVGKDEKLLHREGDRHVERRSLSPRGEFAILAPGSSGKGCRVVLVKRRSV